MNYSRMSVADLMVVLLIEKKDRAWLDSKIKIFENEIEQSDAIIVKIEGEIKRQNDITEEMMKKYKVIPNAEMDRENERH